MFKKIILMTIVFGAVNIATAQNIQNTKIDLCKEVIPEEKITLCAPNADWLYFTDQKEKNPGNVWIHKKKDGEKMNSFILTEDKESNFKSFDNYIGYVKTEFGRLNFILAKEEAVNKDFVILKYSTEDKKADFYQAYRVVNNRIWTMSCMGPNQQLINKDCPSFIKSFVVKK